MKSDALISLLEGETLELLEEGIQRIENAVHTHSLPVPYSELIALGRRQQQAYHNLKATGELGFTLDQLTYHSDMIDIPHAVNLQFVAQLGEDSGNKSRFNKGVAALHDIKNATIAITCASDTFHYYVEQAGTHQHLVKRDGNEHSRSIS